MGTVFMLGVFVRCRRMVVLPCLPPYSEGDPVHVLFRVPPRPCDSFSKVVVRNGFRVLFSSSDNLSKLPNIM